MNKTKKIEFDYFLFFKKNFTNKVFNYIYREENRFI